MYRILPIFSKLIPFVADFTNNYNQRKADSVDNQQPFKKKKRWQFHYKWKRKRKKDELQSDQVTTESDSLKRPKRNDPDDTEEESPELVPQTAEVEPNAANSILFPSTSKFFPVFSRKLPSLFSKLNPPKFTATPACIEAKKPLKRKSKAKAKNSKTKTEAETTNTITNYFRGTAAADDNSEFSSEFNNFCFYRRHE